MLSDAMDGRVMEVMSRAMERPSRRKGEETHDIIPANIANLPTRSPLGLLNAGVRSRRALAREDHGSEGEGDEELHDGEVIELEIEIGLLCITI